MSTTTGTMTDRELREAVLDELDWAPEVDAPAIGVGVENGVIELSGETTSYHERVAARRSAERVRGVRAIVDHLVVHPPTSWLRTDTDIAKAVDAALGWSDDVPGAVKAEVSAGVVRLIGEVDWNFQREAAHDAVKSIKGVIGVDNLVTLKPHPAVSQSVTTSRVRQALVRRANVDADRIKVSAVGSTVTLSGTVHSYDEKMQAQYAAWTSPNVREVINDIQVRW